MQRFLPLLLTLALAALFPVRSDAATWLVKPDGTGDVPTIFAAIQASIDGDVIELADGTFRGDGNCNYWVYDRTLTVRSVSGDPSTCIIDAEGGDGLVRRVISFQSTGPGFVLQEVTLTGGTALDDLTSTYGGAILMNAGSSPLIAGCVFTGNRAERGGAIFLYDNCSPEIIDCAFLDNTATAYAGAIAMTTGCAPLITGSVFRGNSAGAYGGALTVWNGAAPWIYECTFHGNAAPDGGSTVWCRWGGAPAFENSILAFSTAGNAVACESGDGYPTLLCCNVFGNAGGDWVDCIAGLDAGNGNMSADPLFCDVAAGDLRLQWGSPCLPAHSGGCGQVGAHGAGNCPSLDVEPSSFARIKARYRE